MTDEECELQAGGGVRRDRGDLPRAGGDIERRRPLLLLADGVGQDSHDDEAPAGPSRAPDEGTRSRLVGQVARAIERSAFAIAQAQALAHRVQRERVVRGGGNNHAPLAHAVRERLAASEARFRALVAVAGHVTFTTNADGAMTGPQAAWRGYTAQSSAESLADGGFGWINAIHPDDRDRLWQRCRESIARGEHVEAQARIRRVRAPRFEWRDNIIRLVPVRDADGRTVEWVGANIDVTEFVRARDLAESAAREARDAAERARDAAEQARTVAEAATAAKGRVLAATTHDLRSPLAAIAGYTAVLETEMLGGLNDAQRGVLERMSHAQKHLLTLVSDILRAAEAESGEVHLDIIDVELGPVCETLETLVKPLAEGKGVQLRCDLPDVDGAAVAVHADRDRVLQILVNLVTNAIKFTEPHGFVTVDAVVDKEWTLVRVSDTGCGIPRSEHETIFMPFVQMGRPSAAEAGAHPPVERGVGLGLATSRNMARRMGGDLTVASERGAGAVFTLRLPSGMAPAG